MKILPFLIWLFSAIFLYYEFILRGAPSVMSQAIMQHYNITGAGFGSLLACYSFSYAIVQIPIGIIIDRIGAIKVLVVSYFVIALGSLLFCISNNFYIAMLGRTLIGVGTSGGFIAIFYVCSVWFSSKKIAAIASGIGYSAANLGSISINAGGAIALQYITWVRFHLIASGVGVALGVIGLLFLTQKNKTSSVLMEKIKELREQAKDEQRFLKKYFLTVSTKVFMLNALSAALFFLPKSAFAQAWAPIFFAQAYGYSPIEAGYMASTFYTGYLLGNISMGSICSIFDKKKVLIINCFLATFVSIAVFYGYVGHFWLKVAVFLFGMLVSSQILQFSIATDLIPKKVTGLGLAVVNCITMSLGAFMQSAIGFILDHGQKTGVNYSIATWNRATVIFPIGIALAFIVNIIIMKNRSKSLGTDIYND